MMCYAASLPSLLCVLQPGQREEDIKQQKQLAMMFTVQLIVCCGLQSTADCVSSSDHLATAASEVREALLWLIISASSEFKKLTAGGQNQFILGLFICFPEHWENHPDLPEIMALQGRTTVEEGTGERDDEDDGESSTEPEEERDRDADDDEDGDDEDEGFGRPRRKEEKSSGFTVNMYNVLRENECEWWQQRGKGRN